MCGRYSLTTPEEALRQLFDCEVPARNLQPRYNIAPTQLAPIVRLAADTDGRELALLRWGLIPAWAKDPAIGNRMINARAETAASKPSFRDAFRRRRCLVLADGFYEWQRDGDAKQPYRICREDGQPFAFAGLWERWQGPAQGGDTVIESFTILTTDADERLRPIHHRMPVILSGEHYGAWLDAAATAMEVAQALLAAGTSTGLGAYKVSRHVNSPRNDDAACFAPLEDTPSLL